MKLRIGPAVLLGERKPHPSMVAAIVPNAFGRGRNGVQIDVRAEDGQAVSILLSHDEGIQHGAMVTACAVVAMAGPPPVAHAEGSAIDIVRQ